MSTQKGNTTMDITIDTDIINAEYEKYKEYAESLKTIYSRDIKAIREYREKLEDLHLEEPAEKVKPEEWKDFFSILEETGQFPEKYRGRIGEKEELIYTEMRDGKPVPTPEGKKKKIYYDIAFEEVNAKYYELQREYHESILKALFSYFNRYGNVEENETVEIVEILKEIVEDPSIKREIEKQEAASKMARLEPLGSMPNGDSLNWLFLVLNSNKGGRFVQEDSSNRHEKINILQKGESLSFVRKNEEKGTTFIVEIDQADKYLSKTNITFTKVLSFILQKMTAQHFPLEVGFSLHELVELGMYSNIQNARRAVKEFYSQQKLTTISGTSKKGKKVIKEEGGQLFYHYNLENGFVKLSVNPNFNMEFIASYFTVFPKFAYALSNNAFTLMRYIFFLARQNTQSIKDKGTFTISLEAVRKNLGLPPVDEVKNRKYRQYIIDPIEKAIEEIEESLLTVPEAKEYGFTITPYGTETNNINQWLQGYLEIGLKGDFAETFIQIATKAENDRKQWEKAKQKELARIEARAEAKEEKDSSKHKKKKK